MLIVASNPWFRGFLRTLYFEKVKVPLHAGVTYADGRSKEAVSRQAMAGNRPTPLLFARRAAIAEHEGR